MVVDCTTVVPTLSGSEFFGHERGAFTGAVAARDGAFGGRTAGRYSSTRSGTCPCRCRRSCCVSSRRARTSGSAVTPGGTRQFRLVCATNRPLQEAVKGGQFRSDLYHRIAAWSCELPPLRQRRDDILPLATHFISELIPALGRPTFDPAVTDFIAGREYPGNVRELRFLMARVAARHVGNGPITVGSLPDAERPADSADRSAWWQGQFEEAVGHAVSMGVGLAGDRQGSAADCCRRWPWRPNAATCAVRHGC